MCVIMRLAWCLAIGLWMSLAQEAEAQSAHAMPSTAEDDHPSENAEFIERRPRLQEQVRLQGVSGKGSPPLRETTMPSIATARGLSNAFNPSISATTTILGGGTNRPHAPESDHEEGSGDLASGFGLQEVEIRLGAIVDPYFRADVTLAGNLEEIGFEEAYLTTISMPWVNIRAGKMLANLGHHNLVHTHAFPFLTAPVPWRVLLGPEGLRDPGVSADILLPLPFFAEVNAQAFNGEWLPMEGGSDDGLAPDARRDEDLAYLGHVKTLFDLTESMTAGIGGTYAGGRNGYDDLTSIVGGDLRLKWRPIGAERYTSFEWTTEYLSVHRRGAPTDTHAGGLYTALRCQFAQRWWVQGRGSLLGIPKGETGRVWRGEALLALIPSEFSALRLQYAFETSEDGPSDRVHELHLQAIVSIGSHPSHSY